MKNLLLSSFFFLFTSLFSQEAIQCYSSVYPAFVWQGSEGLYVYYLGKTIIIDDWHYSELPTPNYQCDLVDLEILLQDPPN